MESRELSKMQIRSEVTAMLQQMSAFDEIPKYEYDKFIALIDSIENKQQVLEVLVKELPRVDYKQGKIICQLLSEFGTLEQLKDVLWGYIKDTVTSDEVKDLAGITLRNLGDNSDPEEFLSYLKDPKNIIDKETEKLLEVAVINPEAQIDFLDFLFALPEEGQIDLLSSLKNDFSGDHLANILSTALESNPSDKVKEVCISILGETRSATSVSLLTNIENFSNNESLKKLARKSLNMLKISGINIDEAAVDTRGAKICEITQIHGCYASMVDGMGSQGVIFSRIKDNKDVLMFGVVINDIDGIVDCFGFYGISTDDFNRIIERFQQGGTKVPIDPEYCKYILQKAESINKAENTKIPYEYIAWKSLLYDIDPLPDSLENIAAKWEDIQFIANGEILYKHPDFKHWFLKEEDHPAISQIMDKIITYVMGRRIDFIENPDELINWLEHRVDVILDEIFDEKWKKLYIERFLNVAYLFDKQGLNNFKKTASSIAMGLKENSKIPITKISFFREFMRKTMNEGFLRYKTNLDNEDKANKLASWGIKKTDEINTITNSYSYKPELNAIVDILYNNWQKS